MLFFSCDYRLRFHMTLHFSIWPNSLLLFNSRQGDCSISIFFIEILMWKKNISKKWQRGVSRTKLCALNAPSNWNCSNLCSDEIDCRWNGITNNQDNEHTNSVNAFCIKHVNIILVNNLERKSMPLYVTVVDADSKWNHRRNILSINWPRLRKGQNKRRHRRKKKQKPTTLIERDELAADRVRNRWCVGDNK